MRGKKTDNETVYKIMLSYFHTNNFAETARQLNIPLNTVEDIYKKNKDREDFIKLRIKKEDEFIEKATRIIDKAINRLEKELETEKQIQVNQLSTVIGTMYDKRALSKGETTENTNITVTIETIK